MEQDSSVPNDLDRLSADQSLIPDVSLSERSSGSSMTLSPRDASICTAVWDIVGLAGAYDFDEEERRVDFAAPTPGSGEEGDAFADESARGEPPRSKTSSARRVADAVTLPKGLREAAAKLPGEEGSGRALGQIEIVAPAPEAGAEEKKPLYRLRRLIGEGGNGEVWEAEQASLSRLVAIKRIRESVYRRLAGDEVLIRKREAEFRQEVLVTARLDHPGIVPVLDLGADGEGRPLLAMRLVSGTPWNKLVERDRVELERDDFLRKHLAILANVSRAVAYAHSRGIIHRDLKPSQVMIGQYGETLLIDWGLALFANSAEYADPEDTLPPPDGLPTPATATCPAGTPALMSPEQTRRDALAIGPWTDIYLLGGTLYYLLTSKFPHSAENARLSFQLARNGVVIDPRDRSPDHYIPAELADLAMACLAHNGRNRPASVMQVVERIESFLSGSARRHEAVAIYDRVEAFLNDPEGHSYLGLGNHDSLLSRAVGLWPGDPRASRLRQRLLCEYGRFALGQNDLEIAQVCLDRLENSGLANGEVQELSTMLRDQRSRRERLARQHRLLARATVALLCLLVIGLTIYQQSQRTHAARLAGVNAELQTSLDGLAVAKVKVEEELVVSNRLRGNADRFVMLFLSGVVPQLDRLSDHRSIEETVECALDYLGNLEEHDLSDDRRRVMVAALLNGGAIALKKYDLDEAERYFDQAEALLGEGSFGSDPEDEVYRLEALRRLEYRRNHLAAARDRPAEIRAGMQRAMELTARMKNDFPEQMKQSDFFATSAEIESDFGGELLSDGELAGAALSIARSSQDRRALLGALEGDIDAQRDVIAALRRLAEWALAAGDRVSAAEAIRLAGIQLDAVIAANSENALLAADRSFIDILRLQLEGRKGPGESWRSSPSYSRTRQLLTPGDPVAVDRSGRLALASSVAVLLARQELSSSQPEWSEVLNLTETTLAQLGHMSADYGPYRRALLELIRASAVFHLGARATGFAAAQRSWEAIRAYHEVSPTGRTALNLAEATLLLADLHAASGDQDEAPQLATKVLRDVAPLLEEEGLTYGELEALVALAEIAGGDALEAPWPALLARVRASFEREDVQDSLPLIVDQMLTKHHAVVVTEIAQCGQVVEGGANRDYVQRMAALGVRHKTFDRFVAAFQALDAAAPEAAPPPPE
jgi:serine/threonine protein kinase